MCVSVIMVCRAWPAERAPRSRSSTSGSKWRSETNKEGSSSVTVHQSTVGLMQHEAEYLDFAPMTLPESLCCAIGVRCPWGGPSGHSQTHPTPLSGHSHSTNGFGVGRTTFHHDGLNCLGLVGVMATVSLQSEGAGWRELAAAAARKSVCAASASSSFDARHGYTFHFAPVIRWPWMNKRAHEKSKTLCSTT